MDSDSAHTEPRATPETGELQRSKDGACQCQWDEETWLDQTPTNLLALNCTVVITVVTGTTSVHLPCH